jgi:FdrA protein
VAEAVREHARRLATPVLVAPLGPGQPDLTHVAEDILARLDVAVPRWSRWEPRSTSHTTEHTTDTDAGVLFAGGGSSDGLAGDGLGGGGAIRGLFSGGTLCVEAMVIASATLGPIWSNVPLRPEWTLVSGAADGHIMLDLGADEYTVGRPHPMVDFGPRLALLAAEAADQSSRVLLLDVVLGHGAHPDPAAELAPAIRSALANRSAIIEQSSLTGDLARGAWVNDLTVVISLVGTPEDPQDRVHQGEALGDAGAWVFASNAEAARYAAELVRAAPAAAIEAVRSTDHQSSTVKRAP